jgi:fumarylacetoacetase
MNAPNETHAPDLRAWIDSANAPDTDFPVQNLPFGVFRRPGDRARIGVAIGDQILDVAVARGARMLEGSGAEACEAETLNGLMALGPEAWTELRAQMSALLREDGGGRSAAVVREGDLLVAQRDVELLLPARVGDYTDFYASLDHATHVGSMFRPDNPLLPNYKWIPIGYHGRASSVVVSGTPVRRPSGQRKPPEAEAPVFGPSRMLDYELEVGAWIGAGNALGETIPVADADRHIFGLSLLNDWSARDVQAWEYQPLGPFLGKSFATTVSPWIVTWEALAPFLVEVPARAPGDPAPLPYLDAGSTARHAVALTLDVWLQSAAMRSRGLAPLHVSRGSLAGMYWTFPQMVAHHASNGCNLRPGDLLGSGTVSGPEPEARGCLLERTWRGRDLLALPGGEQRAFLEDGDEVTLTGRCAREGYRAIGFGGCGGRVG